jgi:hypothetical protein
MKQWNLTSLRRLPEQNWSFNPFLGEKNPGKNFPILLF